MAKNTFAGTSVDPDALTGPLYITTICCYDISGTKTFFEALGLSISLPIELSEEDLSSLQKLWDISPDVKASYYQVNSDSCSADPLIRLLALELEEDDTNIDHPPAGPPSIRISVEDIATSVKRLELAGFTKSVPEVNTRITLDHNQLKSWKEQDFIGPGNIVYTIYEPEAKKDELSELEETEEDSSIATYLSLSMQEDVELFSQALGLATDYNAKIATDKAGQRHSKHSSSANQLLLHAKGDQSRLLQLVQMNNVNGSELTARRMPHQGVVMWSFETRDIGEILARCHAKQIKIYRTPRKVHDPIYGVAISMTVLSPSGFIIEIFNRA